MLLLELMQGPGAVEVDRRGIVRKRERADYE
jgi:hypothetical protein